VYIKRPKPKPIGANINMNNKEAKRLIRLVDSNSIYVECLGNGDTYKVRINRAQAYRILEENDIEGFIEFRMYNSILYIDRANNQ